MPGLRAAWAAVLFATPCALALNPALDVSQYAHTSWNVRDGFTKGAIYSIAQTRDGYLWLGTEFGLVRFDGVRTDPWTPPAGTSLPSDFIYCLLAARDGRLWIGSREGLASWKDGKLSVYGELAGQAIFALLEDHEGTVWAGSASASDPSAGGRLCAVRNTRLECSGQHGEFGAAVGSLYEDGDTLWVGGATGLWRWTPGPARKYPMPFPGIQPTKTLIKGDDSKLLIGTSHGLKKLNSEHIEAYTAPGVEPDFSTHALLRDRDGRLWIGTLGQGLLHFRPKRTDAFTQSDGLSGVAINSLFEDREGNIWVATDGGLDRFRDFAIPTLSVKQGLATGYVWSVLAAKDGSIWVGTRGGLSRWFDGNATVYDGSSGLPGTVESLFENDSREVWVSSPKGITRFENGRFVTVGTVPAGETHFIANDRAGGLWFSQQRDLVHWAAGNVVDRIDWSDLGHPGGAMDLVADTVHGGQWIGFYPDGLAFVKDRSVRASYSQRNGLGRGAVASIHLDNDGTLWAATEGGLSRVKDGVVATLDSRGGLPCDAVHWVTEDDNESFWLYTACGLVRIARIDVEAWASNPKKTVPVTILDRFDGVLLRAMYTSGYSPRVSKAPDGKIWFVTGSGVSVIDPRDLRRNPLPPPVYIEQLNADGRPHIATQGLRLPSRVRDVAIRYTALSLAAPEKIHFRYKLEGQDRDWREVVNERQVQYSNLPPRKYRFRVTASNNSGVWNEAGEFLDFSVDPAYYQTRWFQAACLAAFLGVLWGLYRYRLHRIATEFNMRLEERVNERTRMARDLHDTLLQSVQGLMLRLQVVDDLLPDGKPKEQLEQALERADQAIAEARSAVYDIRLSTTITNSLAEALKAMGEELARQDTAAFHLVVEGPVRDLHPIIRDELYRIAREALRNAFGHARARHVEAEITYGERGFRFRIRDDGIGIPSTIMEEGRSGHYGLRGMRERAKQIGGELDIWSRAGAGTEIEFSIPGSIAYRRSKGHLFFRLFRKKSGEGDPVSKRRSPF